MTHKSQSQINNQQIQKTCFLSPNTDIIKISKIVSAYLESLPMGLRPHIHHRYEEPRPMFSASTKVETQIGTMAGSDSGWRQSTTGGSYQPHCPDTRLYAAYTTRHGVRAYGGPCELGSIVHRYHFASETSKST